MSNFKTVPNQKIISIHKQTCGKGNVFAQINMNALELAAQKLPAGPFKLWIYFAKNQDNYNFALSYTDAQERFGLGRSQYDTAISTLIKEKYLVETKTESNIYDFYEVPKKDSTYSENLNTENPNTTYSENPNTSSIENQNTTYSENQKRNITYNNTINNTYNITDGPLLITQAEKNPRYDGNTPPKYYGNTHNNISNSINNNNIISASTPEVEKITQAEAAAMGCTEWSVHWLDKANRVFEFEGKRYKM